MVKITKHNVCIFSLGSLSEQYMFCMECLALMVTFSVVVHVQVAKKFIHHLCKMSRFLSLTVPSQTKSFSN